MSCLEPERAEMSCLAEPEMSCLAAEPESLR